MFGRVISGGSRCCAVNQGQFSGEQRPRVRTNPDLPGKWLFWTGPTWLLGSVSGALPPGEDFIDIGHHVNHELYMKMADYIYGILDKFVLFTLPTTEPAEVFVKIGAPGAPHAGATNLRMNPAARQNFNLIIPQQIQPSP